MTGNNILNIVFKNSYNFNVIATDPDGSKDTENVTVNVLNSNDEPKITSGSTVSLTENLNNSTIFYTATASDQDAGHDGNIQFSITSDATDDSEVLNDCEERFR